MGKFKKLYPDHRGYTISGVVTILDKKGHLKDVSMTPVFLPKDKLSHNTIKRCINAGHHYTRSIESAKVNIYRVYGFEKYKQLDKTIYLSKDQCKDSFVLFNHM